MFVRKTIQIAIACLCAFLPSATKAEEPKPVRGEANAVCVDKDCKVKMILSDQAWQACKPWPMGACTADNSQKYKTEARVLFDEKNVYVAVVCEEPETDQLAKSTTERDGPVWKDDSVEVFIRPDPEEPYYQFAANPVGALMDVKCVSTTERDAKWNSTAEVITSIDRGKNWTVIFRIPMNEISAYVGKNQTWTLNLYRTRPKRGDEPAMEYSWAIMMSNNYHSPMDFGMLKGVNVASVEGGVTRVRAEPAPQAKTYEKGKEVGGVVVYRRIDFDKDAGGFTPSSNAEQSLVDDAVSGKALKTICKGKWAGPGLAFDIGGSKGLRMAFLAKAKNFPLAANNVNDRKAKDNTTSYAHRFLPDGEWTPVLYYLDLYRYNSRQQGYVSGSTAYSGVRFYGPVPKEDEVSLILDNFVLYRNADRQPPEKVTGLKAVATTKGIQLTWDVAKDNVCPMVYVISRSVGDGKYSKIAESYRPQYLDISAEKNTCRYRVLAGDFENNLGLWSDAVQVVSVSEPEKQELTVEEKDRQEYSAHVREVHARGAGKVRKNHICLYGDSLTFATTYRQKVMSACGIYTVKAHGFPSMTTGWGRANVEQRALAPENPEIMMVIYGTNNVLGRMNKPEVLEKWVDDMEAIVKAGEARGTIVVLGTIPPRKFDDPDSKPEAAYNKVLIARAHKLKIPVAYIFRDLQASGDRKKIIAADGVHWTGPGMEIAGKAWARTLKQVAFALRDRPGE